MKILRWQRPQLSAWSGVSDLSALRNEIDLLFGAPLGEFARRAGFLSDATPALDVYEGKDAFVVKAELPGMKKEDIQVSVHDGSLSLSGERKVEGNSADSEVLRSEHFFGRFERTLALPAAVNAEKISAQYLDGVLTVTLPKAEEAKPKQINVQVN